MNVVNERPGRAYLVYCGEGECSVALARPGWTVKLRNVRVKRLAPDGSDWLVEALPEDFDESEWVSAVFDSDADEARVQLPDSVRLTQRTGRVAEIDRRSDSHP